jgi:hypothetical protein
MYFDILLESVNFYQKKYLATKLEFNPENLTLKILTLGVHGFLNKEFHIDHILPWSYEGYFMQIFRYEDRFQIT